MTQGLLKKLQTKITTSWERLRGITISNDYARMNQSLHESNTAYGTSASKWCPLIELLCRETGSTTVIDYGCGKGLLKEGLSPIFTVHNYDPAVPEWNKLPQPAEIVTCTDVLEHIEPHLLNANLKALAQLSKVATFLVISTRAASKSLPDGRNAHLIQKNVKWWMATLAGHFKSTYLFHEYVENGEFACLCMNGPTKITPAQIEKLAEETRNLYLKMPRPKKIVQKLLNKN